METLEKEIISGIRHGNLAVFEKLYFEWQPRLFAFSKKFVSDSEHARDIVQEVFSEFWENRNKIQITTSVKSYLFRMIHNKCLNYIRDLKIREKYTDYIGIKLKEAELLYFNQDQDSYKSIFFEEIQAILQKSIEELPANCREIFILSRHDGLSNREIAEKLGISVRTVENQIYRALIVLKENFKDYLPAFPFLISLFLNK